MKEDVIEKNYPIPKASELLGWKEATLRRKVLRREIGYVKVGRLVRIPESEIRRILDSGYHPPVTR